MSRHESPLKQVESLKKKGRKKRDEEVEEEGWEEDWKREEGCLCGGADKHPTLEGRVMGGGW